MHNTLVLTKWQDDIGLNVLIAQCRTTEYCEQVVKNKCHYAERYLAC